MWHVPTCCVGLGWLKQSISRRTNQRPHFAWSIRERHYTPQSPPSVLLHTSIYVWIYPVDQKMSQTDAKQLVLVVPTNYKLLTEEFYSCVNALKKDNETTLGHASFRLSLALHCSVSCPSVSDSEADQPSRFLQWTPWLPPVHPGHLL